MPTCRRGTAAKPASHHRLLRGGVSSLHRDGLPGELGDDPKRPQQQHYLDLPTGNRGENLHRPIDCYEAASRVYTETDFPADWAMTQYNLGHSYAQHSAGERHAPSSRQRLLRGGAEVYRETGFPVDWAMTQNNLGNAYADLPTGNRDKNLHRALTATNRPAGANRDGLPVAVGGTQNNLGNVYSNLPRGTANLHRAIDCFGSALRVEPRRTSRWTGRRRSLISA